MKEHDAMAVRGAVFSSSDKIGIVEKSTDLRTQVLHLWMRFFMGRNLDTAGF
jgi:hypothetical protein